MDMRCDQSGEGDMLPEGLAVPIAWHWLVNACWPYLSLSIAR
jgi:hypothetical protein